MTWAKVDDRLWDDPRVEQAGLEAFGLWARALSFVAARRTGGIITKQQLAALAGHKAHWLAQRLVNAGLWTIVQPKSFRFVDAERFLVLGRNTEPRREPPPVTPPGSTIEPPYQPGGVGGGVEPGGVVNPPTNPPPQPGGVAAPPFPSPPIDPCARAPISDLRSGSLIGISGSGSSGSQKPLIMRSGGEEFPLFAGIPIEPVVTPLDPVDEVWAVYLAGRAAAGLKGSPPILDEKRRRLIGARLSQLPLEDVRDAAAGIWLDPWHVERRKVEPEYVFRDTAHVEKFRDVKREGPADFVDDGFGEPSWPENQPGAIPPPKFPPPPPPPIERPPETEESLRRREEIRAMPIEEIKRLTAQTMGLWGPEHAFGPDNV